jgi:excisionase family DNA binding protein
MTNRPWMQAERSATVEPAHRSPDKAGRRIGQNVGGNDRRPAYADPLLLTVDEVADLLRTTRKGVYAMAERGQLPGVRRVGRRLLVRRSELLHWLDHNCAPSPKGEGR